MPGLSPSEGDILTGLRAWLLSILPSGTEVIQGQVNRVPEPESSNFVIMTPLFKMRLSTNLHDYADVQFTAMVADDILTVSAVKFGKIGVGNQIWDVGGLIPLGTTIVSGPSAGGVGAYQLSAGGLSVASSTMAAGVEIVTGPVEAQVQLDVHAANLSNAGDMATSIVTLFRDAQAVDFFTANSPGIAPLYADDPHQIPFQN